MRRTLLAGLAAAALLVPLAPAADKEKPAAAADKPAAKPIKAMNNVPRVIMIWNE